MEFTAPGIDFGGTELVGGPHFSVADKASETKFVYLHSSRWEKDQTEAFCELLAVVLEKKFKAGARDCGSLTCELANVSHGNQNLGYAANASRPPDYWHASEA